MHASHRGDERCDTSVALGRALAALAGNVAGVGMAVLGLGVARVRSVIETAAWGPAPGARLPACGCGRDGCIIRHHWCCSCVPPHCGPCGG